MGSLQIKLLILFLTNANITKWGTFINNTVFFSSNILIYPHITVYYITINVYCKYYNHYCTIIRQRMTTGSAHPMIRSKNEDFINRGGEE